MEILKRVYIYAGIFILTSFLLFIFLWNRKTDLENAYLLQKAEKVKSEFKAVLDGYDKVVFFIYEKYINQPDIKSILYEASNSDGKINEHRETLYQKLRNIHSILKLYGIKHITFIFPDGTVFLRLNNPEKYGDKTKVLSFNNRKRGLKGFVYRFPIFYNRALAGNVEITLSFETIKKDLNRLFNSEHKFLIKKEIILKKLFEEEKNYIQSDLDKNYFYQQEKDFNVIKRLPDEIISSINLDIKNKVKDLLKEGKSFSVYVKEKGNYYIVSFIPLHIYEDTRKKHIGFLVNYEKDNTIGIYSLSFWTSFITTSSIVFLLLSVAFLLSLMREKFIEEAEEIEKSTEEENKNDFYSVLQYEIQRVKRYNRPASLLLIDFPDLKSDSIEEKVSISDSIKGILKENIRKADYLKQIDESIFAILSPETDVSQARNFAERIREILSHTYIDDLGNPAFNIGITEIGYDDTPEKLLKRVKEILYLAEEKGKNTIEETTL